VKEACAEKGIDVTRVEQELQNTDTIASSTRPLPYNEWELDFLADYIVNTHHSYVKKNLPDIVAYSNKVHGVHGGRHSELQKVNELVAAVNAGLTSHLVKEERVLFPYIKNLVAQRNKTQDFLQTPFGTVKEPINMMEMEHEAVSSYLTEIRKITNNYFIPEDACASYSLLYRMLPEFEDDLYTHIHLENNILFPKAIELEKSIS